jgi:DNA-binding transcriptional LysR family regulator
MILVSKISNENVINSIESIEYLNIAMHYSLDQFQTFLAVVDHGVCRCGARLGRSQSTITYAIRALEEQTGLILFDRAHYRPQLTSAGKALLPRARRLVEDLW